MEISYCKREFFKLRSDEMYRFAIKISITKAFIN